MRRTVAVATLAVIGALGTVVPAQAAGAPNHGLLCGYTVTDPVARFGVRTGEMDGGPLALTDDDDPARVHSGHVRCTIQLGAPTHRTPGDADVRSNDTVSVAGPEAPAVAWLPPTPVSFTGTEELAYLCTEVVVDGTPFYWDDDSTPDGGAWSNDPETARCAISLSTTAVAEPARETVAHVVGESFACAALPVVFPPQGDVPGVWDCPPYDVRTAAGRAFPDAVICPILKILLPPDGDVRGVWDCPPYEPPDPDVVCRVIAVLFPHDGDVAGVWDCPPYDRR